ncbi:M15 family metallopeptidase [Vibrio sp. S4M6]|uniref:M15 family metallopeptidase n=1 Tax=Vibrio sinus TaxID=2946865 RepID=UPI002029CD40|nr:M15 family metallopeptidase [Vibrio sinus]MCL9782527.1 M15 family metallopeptidase [Vibrio sinus]
MTPTQLTGIDSSHLTSLQVGNKHFLLNPDVKQDLIKLQLAAEKAGFQFFIASGFRSFEQQNVIWQRKMSGELAIRDRENNRLDTDVLSEAEKIRAILNWSALPGASRHHWGTDFDVYDGSSITGNTELLLEPWEYESGHQAKFSTWLKANVERYGFFFPYDTFRGGVAFEPWHISHLKTSKQCLAQLTLQVLKDQLLKSEILGHQSITTMLDEIYNQYIININPTGRQ